MKRSGFQIMARLVGLVKPLSGYMILAIIMGLISHLCAAFITIVGGQAILHVLHPEWSMSIGVLFGAALIFALVRGFLRYAEQACNHFIAFKLLALVRDKVFGALSGFFLDSLRGLSETIQYGQGERKMADMNAQTHNLSRDEERMKRTAGRNTAVTNTVILISFTTGLFGMILDQFPIVLILHRVISIALVFFLAIHIFVFHKKLR